MLRLHDNTKYLKNENLNAVVYFKLFFKGNIFTVFLNPNSIVIK